MTDELMAHAEPHTYLNITRAEVVLNLYGKTNHVMSIEQAKELKFKLDSAIISAEKMNEHFHGGK